MPRNISAGVHGHRGKPHRKERTYYTAPAPAPTRSHTRAPVSGRGLPSLPHVRAPHYTPVTPVAAPTPAAAAPATASSRAAHHVINQVAQEVANKKLASTSQPGAVLARVLGGLTDNQKALALDVISASRKYNVPASVLMGLTGVESNYGENTGPSSAGAQGVTQFIPSTAQAYGVKFGAGKKAVQSQVFGAAKYLKDLGFDQDPVRALNSYNGDASPSNPYARDVLNAAKGFTHLDQVAQGGKTAKGGPYAYPFGKQITIGRTDMGIDPSGSGVIRTIGRAKYLGTGGAGWPTEGGTGTGPVYKLLKGPQKGKRVYTYEGITPRTGLRPGQVLPKGAPIARSTGSSFETGYAQGRAAGFQPLASGHYTEGDVTPEGAAFAKFVGSTQRGGRYPVGNVTFGGSTLGAGVGGGTILGSPPTAAGPGAAAGLLTAGATSAAARRQQSAASSAAPFSSSGVNPLAELLAAPGMTASDLLDQITQGRPTRQRRRTNPRAGII